MKKVSPGLIFAILIAGSMFLNDCQSQSGSKRSVIQAIAPVRYVDTTVMRKVFEEVKTPYKYGIILRSDSAEGMVDCPTVFYHKGRWYMMFIEILRETGYQTWLAESDDLLHWKRLGRILSFTRGANWDAWQADGGIALSDHNWGGSGKMQKYKGRYWLSYIGGALKGYEPDPLSIGIAWTRQPHKIVEWTRINQNPVLTPHQEDTREFESKTLYKSQIIFDIERSLGYQFVMFYNGKYRNGFEQIGMAVSDDMISWKRYGTSPVISNGVDMMRGISGDPQVVKIGDVWVMFYFGAFWKPGAFDTFACSYDLVHWTKWKGPHLVEPGESYDSLYAHKPWVIKWNGIVYHFYCAVGSEGRAIAVATSINMK